jgi:hypothetical protein
MDLDSTLSVIDEAAVHHCGHCDTVLGPEAPSTLFCDDVCQEAFYAARSEALVGYREPVELAAHYSNQREVVSPETACGLTATDLFNVPTELVTPTAPARQPTAVRRLACSCGEPVSRLRGEALCRRCTERLSGVPDPVGPGAWRAHFAAPWNPGMSVVPSEGYGDMPPLTLRGIRPIRLSIWLDDMDPNTTAEDRYQLESYDQDTRDAVYRVQNLQSHRYIVFRPGPGVPDSWLGSFNGRWEEVDRQCRSGQLFGGNCVVRPTVRYEVREDGVYAEVWECRPRHGFRATERMGQVVSERTLDIAVNLTTGEQSRALTYDDIVRLHDTIRRINPRGNR